MIRDGALAKGDCLAAAQAAGILAAKKTPALIPLCHPLPVSFVDLSFSFRRDFLEIESVVKASYSTGVDMAKAYDKNMTITNLHVVEKRGGKNDFSRRKSTGFIKLKIEDRK
jgi:cyclic pyranopterin phosphate synthase